MSARRPLPAPEADFYGNDGEKGKLPRRGKRKKKKHLKRETWVCLECWNYNKPEVWRGELRRIAAVRECVADDYWPTELQLCMGKKNVVLSVFVPQIFNSLTPPDTCASLCPGADTPWRASLVTDTCPTMPVDTHTDLMWRNKPARLPACVYNL